MSFCNRLAAVALYLVGMQFALAQPDADKGRLQYVHHCTGCHQLDGSGVPASGVPSMRGALGRFLQVPGGRQFIVQVPGVMNTVLSDEQIADMMNWLLAHVTPQTVPAGTPPYTALEIASLRANRPVDVAATREALARAYQARYGSDIDAPLEH